MADLVYKDGKTSPLKGDKVLGDKLKGVVATVLNGKVQVSTLAPFNPKRPSERKQVLVERDAADLELVYRKP